MGENTLAIEIRGLTKAFRGHLGIGRTTVVKGLDLEVRRGEVFGLLGPNGAGKTTSIKMMLGLLRPDSGSVKLFGRSPRDPQARAMIGFLPENPYFYDYLTASEFLDFYGRLQGLAGANRRRRVNETLRRVGLAGHENVALRKFSKGMIQRVGLAQAIQHSPELVVLDEPMSGLDPVGRREVRDLILNLRDGGTTVCFSSHILQDAEMICDRVAILKQGTRIAAGSLNELIEPTVRWFEVSVRGVQADLLQAEVVSESADALLVRVTDAEHLARLIEAVKVHGGDVVSVWPRKDSLEDFFLRQVREVRDVS
ncbi:MAG: ABC transporter ATP-binding protein [Acidobacteriota bacterium]|nr:ABC transporter ATP-binding protein [Acidobacteriota bacterium]MDH3783949.1 ABC transporter ATP-binding protein [Acidobacteriota bacterium]